MKDVPFIIIIIVLLFDVISTYIYTPEIIVSFLLIYKFSTCFTRIDLKYIKEFKRFQTSEVRRGKDLGHSTTRHIATCKERIEESLFSLMGPLNLLCIFIP